MKLPHTLSTNSIAEYGLLYSYPSVLELYSGIVQGLKRAPGK